MQSRNVDNEEVVNKRNLKIKVMSQLNKPLYDIPHFKGRERIFQTRKKNFFDLL